MAKGVPRMDTILVVDDQLQPRRLLIDELEDAGFAVVEASDGEEAWELFCRNPPHLVITDIGDFKSQLSLSRI